MRTAILGLSLAASTLVTAAPLHAAFFFEGLAPYARSYCDGAVPGTSDPFIAPPPETWEKTSPDASTLAGAPAWDASRCPAGKFEGSGRYHKSGKANALPPVPQK